MITENRAEKFKHAIAKRQTDLAIILENVHDPHNIGAVLRSCDSVGVENIFIIAPPQFNSLNEYLNRSKTSKGASKWMNIRFYKKISACLETVKNEGYFILGTHLTKESLSLYELNLNKKVALLFGNEHAGISKEALEFVDQNFQIPQVGLVQSLNISVACAVSLYEAFRQRQKSGKYNHPFNAKDPKQAKIYERFVAIHRGISTKNK
jgi:tRNA (guanosine-2'-O-)-methyltransferase